MLISFLIKYAGEPVNFWTPINRVADDLLGHDSRFSPVNRRKRFAKRKEVRLILSEMIRQGKVIRHRDKYTNKVRLNEAFVQNRSLIH